MGEFIQSILTQQQVKPSDYQCISKMLDQFPQANNLNSGHLFDLKVEQLSHIFCTSERNMRRKCQRLFGMTPNELLTQYRIQTAKKLLAQKHCVSDVAFSVGFSTHSHFSTVFKKITGMSPKEYKNQ